MQAKNSQKIKEACNDNSTDPKKKVKFDQKIRNKIRGRRNRRRTIVPSEHQWPFKVGMVEININYYTFSSKRW